MLGMLFPASRFARRAAIEVRHYADIVPLAARCSRCAAPTRSCGPIKFRNGTLKRFKFPIRTTSEAPIDPYGGKPMPKMADLTAPGVYTKEVMGGYRAGKPEELIRRK